MPPSRFGLPAAKPSRGIGWYGRIASTPGSNNAVCAAKSAKSSQLCGDANYSREYTLKERESLHVRRKRGGERERERGERKGKREEGKERGGEGRKGEGTRKKGEEEREERGEEGKGRRRGGKEGANRSGRSGEERRRGNIGYGEGRGLEME